MSVSHLANTSQRLEESAIATLDVLVVDDDADALEVIALMLESGGHRVTGETSARQALARLQAGERFDLVLLDVVMPGMDGVTLLRRLREDPATTMQLVVVCSAGGQRLMAHAMDAGADRVLSKPFRRQDLLTTLTELTRR